MRLTLMRIGIASSLALGGVLGAAALPHPARAADPVPASLQGESFFAYTDTRGEQTAGSATISGECRQAGLGDSYTLTYQAEGPASGPYAGRFTESGTVTATVFQVSGNPPSTTTFGTVLEWQATFEISSETAHVIGTKTLSLVSTQPEPASSCGGLLSFNKGARAVLHYEATIRPVTGGLFTAAGTANSAIHYGQFTCTTTCDWFPSYEEQVLSEQFLTSSGVTQVVPTKADCENGGYAYYGYATEGACKQASKPPKKNR